MNNNIDLTKILKDCKEGTKLYCTLLGEVEFVCIENDCEVTQIVVCDKYTDEYKFTKEGKYYDVEDGECLLFPSKDQRDWSNFKTSWLKKQKFELKTLQPFDKVIVKIDGYPWKCDIFSYYKIENKSIVCYCISEDYVYYMCIPFNNDTKHLVGTNEEAPKYYRYWED